MTMFRFQSTKLYEGFSTVFRQWRAEGTHCSYLHGYGISFKLWFEGELDHRNWVWDFGGFGRTSGRIDGMTPKQWFSYMFDHTVIVAEDDPHLAELTRLEALGLVQLRVVQAVGAEQFARLLYEKLNPLVQQETNGRVRVTRVEFREHERNSAIFEPA
jgi:6-pyruvoyltetrahydropterin/6-carboxytetrahydropterin synthase